MDTPGEDFDDWACTLHGRIYPVDYPAELAAMSWKPLLKSLTEAEGTMKRIIFKLRARPQRETEPVNADPGSDFKHSVICWEVATYIALICGPIEALKPLMSELQKEQDAEGRDIERYLQGTEDEQTDMIQSRWNKACGENPHETDKDIFVDRMKCVRTYVRVHHAKKALDWYAGLEDMLQPVHDIKNYKL